MKVDRFLRRFPEKRINPFDGMAVTADVWQEAHDYHLAYQRLHALYAHGTGIVTGLEVIAGDPPGNSVYVLPGIAIDPDGNVIVCVEPVSFDLGRYSDRLVHLLITYNESRPQSLNGEYGDRPLYVYTGFSIEAVIAERRNGDNVDSPQVELARIDRRHGDPVTDAADEANPAANEIDLRFRRHIGPSPRRQFRIGVASQPDIDTQQHEYGLENLTRYVRQQSDDVAWVDTNLDLSSDLSPYTLVALVATDSFQVEVAEINSLYTYVRNGGTILLESCRSAGGATPRADRSFGDLMESLGIRPESVTRGHSLLREPHFFARPPAGYEVQGSPQLKAGDGVVYTTHDFACLWAGERRSGPAEREAIRSALEWGQNLLRYAYQRRLAINE